MGPWSHVHAGRDYIRSSARATPSRRLSKHPGACRSGQPDVALDAYQHMRGLGLPATPAALRALLEVHMGRGAWEQADALLAAAVDDGGDALDAEVWRLGVRCGLEEGCLRQCS